MSDFSVSEAESLSQEFYNANADAYVSNTFAMTDDEWLERFISLLPANGKVLDVGCAGGRDMQWFLNRGFQPTGIDISGSMLDIAKARMPGINVHRMNILSTSFESEVFDGVWCSCVLLHVPRFVFAAAVKECARVLRSGGIAYFLVKEGQHEGIEEDGRYGGARKFASYFTASELRGAISDAGMELLSSEDLHIAVDDYRATDRLFYMAKKR